MAMAIPLIAGAAASALGGSALTALAVGAGAGMLAGAFNQPKMPQIPAPEKPPQASKTPDRNAVLAGNAAATLPGGAMAGNASTFLTGGSGIDSGTLNLGRNVLLGQ